MIQWMLAIWSLVPLPFLNPAWTSGSSWFTYYWSLAWRILSITLPACEVSAIVQTSLHRGIDLAVLKGICVVYHSLEKKQEAASLPLRCPSPSWWWQERKACTPWGCALQSPALTDLPWLSQGMRVSSGNLWGHKAGQKMGLGSR